MFRLRYGDNDYVVRGRKAHEHRPLYREFIGLLDHHAYVEACMLVLPGWALPEMHTTTVGWICRMVNALGIPFKEFTSSVLHHEPYAFARAMINATELLLLAQNDDEEIDDVSTD